MAAIVALPLPAMAYTWHEVKVPHADHTVIEMVEGVWRVAPYPKGDNKVILMQDNSFRRGWFKTIEDAKAEAERLQKRMDDGLDPKP